MLDLTRHCAIFHAMIRRRSGDSYILITQAQHAQLAAQLAAAIGGALAVPSRTCDLAEAARLHSRGFDSLDALPPLSPAGRPADLEDLALATLLDAWSHSAELALAHSAYAGMMVSLHCLARVSSLASSARSIRDNFQANRIQHRQVEIQQQLRPQLALRNDLATTLGLPDAAAQLTAAESSFYYDYRVMLLCIGLAHELCARRHLIGQLAPTPVSPSAPLSAPSAGAVSITFRHITPTQCHLSPFPFATPLTLTIPARQVPATLYDHESELHEALAASPKIHLALNIVQPT